MWAVGYFGRLPAVLLPSPLLLLLLLACLVGGGIALGRYSSLGWRYGAAAGLVSGALNLLVLGSFLTGDRPNQIVPSAALWLPGSILFAALLAGAGSAVGRRWLRRDPPYREWPAAFVWIGVGATLLLLAVGGLVTSAGAGLAVLDWPNSFGYNMFLYPFSRMTGGIYYEHAHRLFGALVGLTTLVLALVLQRTDSRAWLRQLGWLAFVMVVVQGVLGGLRVTGSFTLSSTPGTLRPSITLAVVHGIFGQIFFATLVAIGVFTSAAWRRGRATVRNASARIDQLLVSSLLGLLLVQLVIGAVQRHLKELLFVHMIVGIAIVAPLAVHVGMRAWGRGGEDRRIRRLGLGLAGAVGLQIALGLATYVTTLAERRLPDLELVLATAHQWFGAVLLALVVMLGCWRFQPLGESA